MRAGGLISTTLPSADMAGTEAPVTPAKLQLGGISRNGLQAILAGTGSPAKLSNWRYPAPAGKDLQTWLALNLQQGSSSYANWRYLPQGTAMHAWLALNLQPNSTEVVVICSNDQSHGWR